MKKDLEKLIEADPLVPCVVTLRSGEAFPVNTVERMMLGTETFCYRDHEGYFRIVPYRAVDQVTTTETPEVH
jgi:hypothetical protein